MKKLEFYFVIVMIIVMLALTGAFWFQIGQVLGN